MHVFVYGTLTDPETVGEVVDSYVFVGDGVLDGLHPVDGRFPTLAPGGETPGRLLRTEDVAALDAYEGVGDDLYVRVAVPLVGVDGADEAAVYVGDPARLDADATWPVGDDEFGAVVRSYCDANDVVVRRG